MNMKRILVIDDEPSITLNLKLTLESGGDYEVLGENNPANALAAAQTFQPDLILLDVMMPDLDGGDVAATASGRSSAPRHTGHLSDWDCFQRGNRRPRDDQRRRDISG